MSNTLLVIPARAGSRRIPRKNILPLGGKPLVVWSIEAALRSGIPSEVCLSTDDKEIAEIGKDAGASVPFLRPAHLSNDDASSVDVVAHAMQFYRKKMKRDFATVALLQPTSPFRDAEDVRKAFQLFFEKAADCVVSVCPAEHSPMWTNTLTPDMSMRGFLRRELKGKRSQDLPQYYRLNGAIYICSVQGFLSEQSLILEHNSFAYIMTEEHSLDIDTELDFKIAEAIASSLVN